LYLPYIIPPSNIESNSERVISSSSQEAIQQLCRDLEHCREIFSMMLLKKRLENVKTALFLKWHYHVLKSHSMCNMNFWIRDIKKLYYCFKCWQYGQQRKESSLRRCSIVHLRAQHKVRKCCFCRWVARSIRHRSLAVVNVKAHARCKFLQVLRVMRVWGLLMR
jgi:hypothetical protein